MNKKISLGVAATIIILAMTVTFSVTMLLAMRLFDSTVTSVKEKESMYSKLSELDRYVRANSFYAIDDTLLYDTLCSGYLVGTGDKYARYYTAEAYTELLNVQNGTLMGIGVELGRDQTGYARVLKVYEDSPAQEAGILEGYYITAVNGADVKLMSSIDTVQARLRGEAGTTVTVTWLDAEKVETTADLTHSGYSITTVDSQMLADNVGYIRIRQFDSATPSELDYAIRSLTAAGAQSLVFDLRDNAGGILEDAMRCIDLVCPEGPLAYAENAAGVQELLGSSSDSMVDLPLVCLVNGNTASAAELFASCLRSMSGARLVGTTTMGKGTIQASPQRMSDGSAVVVTVAKLITCDGTSFDGVGLTVDVERALSADEQAAYYTFTPDSDPQILRAASVAGQMVSSSGEDLSDPEQPEQTDPASSEDTSEEASSEDASSEEASSSEAEQADSSSEEEQG